jgi:hypothetical protein
MALNGTMPTLPTVAGVSGRTVAGRAAALRSARKAAARTAAARAAAFRPARAVVGQAAAARVAPGGSASEHEVTRRASTGPALPWAPTRCEPLGVGEAFGRHEITAQQQHVCPGVASQKSDSTAFPPTVRAPELTNGDRTAGWETIEWSNSTLALVWKAEMQPSSNAVWSQHAHRCMLRPHCLGPKSDPASAGHAIPSAPGPL